VSGLTGALVDRLFADIQPAGRLAMTWSKSLDQLPNLLDYGIRHGRTTCTRGRSRSIRSAMG
jgi:beta-glucosidase